MRAVLAWLLQRSTTPKYNGHQPEIHDPITIFKSYLTRVQTHKGVDQCSGLDSILARLL